MDKNKTKVRPEGFFFGFILPLMPEKIWPIHSVSNSFSGFRNCSYANLLFSYLTHLLCSVVLT